MTLANDVPKATLNNWGLISLPEYLDYNRSGKGWTRDVVAYHITTTDRIDSILINGLKASSCSSWTGGNDRPEAVYLFCSSSVIADNIAHLLDDPKSAIVIKVTIPAQYTDTLYIDNLYNMSIDASQMSAIQYRGDIPSAWITSETE